MIKVCIKLTTGLDKVGSSLVSASHTSIMHSKVIDMSWLEHEVFLFCKYVLVFSFYIFLWLMLGRINLYYQLYF